MFKTFRGEIRTNYIHGVFSSKPWWPEGNPNGGSMAWFFNEKVIVRDMIGVSCGFNVV